jgi:hypothetical protein
MEKKVYAFGFQDNRFDTVALLDIVKEIEEVKKEVSLENLFTHLHERCIGIRSL